MQSRLLFFSKLNKIFPLTPKPTKFPPPFSTAANGGDPMEDTMTQGVDPEGETDPKPESNSQDHQNDNVLKNIPNYPKNQNYINPNKPNFSSSSPKIQTTTTANPPPPEPHKRPYTAATSLPEFACSGLDGTPWPPEDDRSSSPAEGGRSCSPATAEDDRKISPATAEGGRSSSRAAEEDDRQYFAHHKASPLSEIEIVDSRKPLTRVTDGTAGGEFGGGGEGEVKWRPEQVVTAEESLLRAAEMFRERAARGVPEWPHSRRLRELRGEDW